MGSIGIYMGVLLKMLAKPHCTQSGFADHEIPFLKMAISLGRLTQHVQVQSHLNDQERHVCSHFVTFFRTKVCWHR